MGPLASTIGLIVGVVGGGLSYSASVDAAKSQRTFELLNAQAASQQAQQQSAVQALQAQLQQTQAQTAQQAAYDNAAAMRDQADIEAKASLENVRRQRNEFRRGLSAAIAQQGASGATLMTGSPLDLLVAASEDELQSEYDQIYGISTALNRGYRSAAATALGGDVEGVNASLYQLDAMAALAEGRMGVAQAGLAGLAAQSRYQGAKNAALGGLIGNIGSAVGNYGLSWQQRKLANKYGSRS